MAIFATSSRKGVQAGVVTDLAEPDSHARRLPSRFESVGERLTAGRDASAACAMVGRELARDGADLGEALEGLRATYERIVGGEPEFGAVHALGLAWSEETLGYLHRLSCENPLTGLASLAHLRARLTEVYRGADQRGTPTTASHALVVVELPLVTQSAGLDPFAATLRLVRVAESARMAFPGGETIAEANPRRALVLARRADMLVQRVGLLRDLLDDRASRLVAGRTRVWIEGLPPGNDGAGLLLDEIART